MIRYLLPSLAALSLFALGAAADAVSGESPSPAKMERMPRWSADHEAMLNARLAGLKAGLKLTSDQEKLWPPFEAAVRDAAKMRRERMQSMMERMRGMGDMADETQAAAGQTRSPVDRMALMAEGLTERGAALKKVADAARPLYASLDDLQKRLFAMLGGDLWMMGRGHRGMGMMGGAMMGAGGMMGGAMMGDVGNGMTDRGPDAMRMMEGSHSGDEDDFDDE